MVFVLTLLAFLGHDRFAAREAAHGALSKLAPLCWEGLYAVRGPTLESMLRCRAIANLHWPKVPLAERQAYLAKMRPAGWTVLPWLGPSTDSYLERAKSVNGKCYEQWREACRLWVSDYAAWLLPEEVQVALDQMAADELHWCLQYWGMYRSAGGQRRMVR